MPIYLVTNKQTHARAAVVAPNESVAISLIPDHPAWPVDPDQIDASDAVKFSGFHDVVVIDNDPQLRQPGEGPDPSWGALFEELQDQPPRRMTTVSQDVAELVALLREGQHLITRAALAKPTKGHKGGMLFHEQDGEDGEALAPRIQALLDRFPEPHCAVVCDGGRVERRPNTGGPSKNLDET